MINPVDSVDIMSDKVNFLLKLMGLSSWYAQVTATYLAGFKATAVCCVGGRRSGEKGRRTAEAILARSRTIFKTLGLPDFQRTHVQVLGTEDTYGPHAR